MKLSREVLPPRSCVKHENYLVVFIAATVLATLIFVQAFMMLMPSPKDNVVIRPGPSIEPSQLDCDSASAKTAICMTSRFFQSH
jgi:hypothetical protein